MALADPQVVTIATVATDLDRVGGDLYTSVYRSADGQYELSVMQPKRGSRVRSILRLKSTEIVSDPLFPSQNQELSYACTITFDRPKNGVAVADLIALAEALVAHATSARITDIVGGQM